jgi:hypothetical protein
MKNIYEIFVEHLREHDKNKDKKCLDFEAGLMGICPYCKLTMEQVAHNTK